MEIPVACLDDVALPPYCNRLISAFFLNHMDFEHALSLIN